MTGHAEHQRPRLGNRWRVAGWSAAALLLLLPLVAMQFTDEVAWGPGDFLLASTLVAGLGLGCELAVRKSSHGAYRAGAGLALATGFVLVWANAAVGVIGAENGPVNLLFYGVPMVGLAGALVAQFQAREMAYAMLLTALAQSLATGVAVGNEPGIEPAAWAFVGLWVGAAGLFWKAGAME